MVPNAEDVRPGQGRDGTITSFTRFLGRPRLAF
jgi:hypothetical protein